MDLPNGRSRSMGRARGCVGPLALLLLCFTACMQSVHCTSDQEFAEAADVARDLLARGEVSRAVGPPLSFGRVHAPCMRCPP